MALYAFDGTGNTDEGPANEDTNVVRFCEVYRGAEFKYLSGVGTRSGAIGRVAGGLFGLGGRTRIEEMYNVLCENYTAATAPDTDIDIVGYSRGAALAVHFANKIAKEGIAGSNQPPVIRFLGLWDAVASFGLSFNNILNFQEINLFWDVESIAARVQHCWHAMALDERREAFNVTRLDPEHRNPNIQEVWFRGVHGDIGGGNLNTARSNISLQWMLDNAREAGLPINTEQAREPRYTFDPDIVAPISENRDVKVDPRREVLSGDSFHQTVDAKLAVGERIACTVRSGQRYNWSGVTVEPGARYRVQVCGDQTWTDGDITCGPEGWRTEQLPWYKETFVQGNFSAGPN